MVYPAKEFQIRGFEEADDQTDAGLKLAKTKRKDPETENDIWLNVSEIAVLGGLSSKTIRRALDNAEIRFKIKNNRYQISLASAIRFFNSSQKLRNKLNGEGIGRWVKEWKL
jgi:hypothetical protein